MGRPKGSKNGIIIKYPIICKSCQNTFYVLGKNRTGSTRPINFCSQKCYHISRKGIRPIGFIKTPGGAPKGRIPWNKGKQFVKFYKNETLSQYRKIFRNGWSPIRQKALIRDNFTCQCCHISNIRLAVHHIVSFNICRKHELSNLITVCYKCHMKIHYGNLRIT